MKFLRLTSELIARAPNSSPDACYHIGFAAIEPTNFALGGAGSIRWAAQACRWAGLYGRQRLDHPTGLSLAGNFSSTYNLAMLYWECRRRLQGLREFRRLVAEYCRNTGFDSRGLRHENAEARMLRSRINADLPEIMRSASLIGHSMCLTYGNRAQGFAGEINLLTNLFNLDRQRIPVSKAFDAMDRAIGDYERLRNNLRRRSWNPFYWIRMGFVTLLGLPFRLLGVAGFDGRAIEHSLTGRSIKAVGGLVIFLAALLQVLSLLGLPTSLDHIVGLLRHSR